MTQSWDSGLVDRPGHKALVWHRVQKYQGEVFSPWHTGEKKVGRRRGDTICKPNPKADLSPRGCLAWLLDV